MKNNKTDNSLYRVIDTASHHIVSSDTSKQIAIFKAKSKYRYNQPTILDVERLNVDEDWNDVYELDSKINVGGYQ